MAVTIAGIEFTNHSYDERGDVLYRRVGELRVRAETDTAREGHAVDFDAHGNVIGIVLVSVRWRIERHGELLVTWPGGRVSHEAPSEVLPIAADHLGAQPASISSTRGRRNRQVRPSLLAGSMPFLASS